MMLLWVNLGSGILIVATFLAIVFLDRQNAKSELTNIKAIALTAFLVALAVVLNTVVKAVFNTLISANIFEAKLGNFALVLIGFFCGGALGVLGGVAADFLGVLLYSTGTPMLYFTLTSVSWCVVPYYLVRLCNYLYHNKWTIYCYLPLAYALNLLLISGFNPIILTYLYNVKDGLWALYLLRIIKFPFDVGITSILLIISYRTFAKSLTISQALLTTNQPPKIRSSMMKPQIMNKEELTDD